MKKLLLVILVVAYISADAQLKIINATKEQWTGGIPGYSGSNFSIDFKFKERDSIIIDSIYINGKSLKVELTANDVNLPHYYKIEINNKMQMKLLYKESNFVCNFPVYTPDSIKKEQPILYTPKYNGEAVILYHSRGKSKKLAIQKFAILPSINYP